MVAAVTFALQITAVTPLSASTSSQHLENQLEASGDGLLAANADSGALKEAVLYWNGNQVSFHQSSDRAFYQSVGDAPPNNEFIASLERTFGDRNIAYNVNVYYQTSSGGTARQRMVDQGNPSDHAISASRTIALADDDRLVKQDGTLGEQISEANFYAPDASITSGDGEPLYNLLRVEVVAWRI